jgi:hypothetical protein
MKLTQLLAPLFPGTFAAPAPIVVLDVIPTDTGNETKLATPARPQLDPEIAAREATLARAEAFRNTMFCPARLRAHI